MTKQTFCVALLLAGSSLLAQETPANASQHPAKHSNPQVTAQGCVSQSSGDYILMQQDPGVTYELQATGKTKLRNYLGRQVEVTGVESPSLSTSSDALTRTGSPSPVTLIITSIKTLEKECRGR